VLVPDPAAPVPLEDGAGYTGAAEATTGGHTQSAEARYALGTITGLATAYEVARYAGAA
jgi:hypothetical protein